MTRAAAAAKLLSGAGLSCALAAGDLLGRLPPPLGERLGRRLGDLAFALARRERRRTLAHLQLALPDLSDDARRRLARASFRHLGAAALEFGHLPHGGREWVERTVRAEGTENLTHALAWGRGVLYFTGHLGNWELMAAWVAQRAPLWVVARENVHPGVTARFLGIREGLGIRHLLRPREGSSQLFRQVLRVLGRGGVVGMLIDQDLAARGVSVPFFGQPAHTPTAPARLALRTGAPVLFGFIVREAGNGRGGHRIQMRAPYLARPGVEPEEAEAAGLATDVPHPAARGRPREADVLAYTAHFASTIERAIRQAPEQWVWMHRRWRRAASAVHPTGPAR